MPFDEQAPAPHTEQELETVMGLLTGRRSRISAISFGHARDDASRSAAKTIVRNAPRSTLRWTSARVVLDLREHGGLGELIWSHKPDETLVPRIVSEVPTSTPASKALATDLRSRGFRFVGPTTTYALTEAIGMADTHPTRCRRRGSSGQYL